MQIAETTFEDVLALIDARIAAGADIWELVGDAAEQEESSIDERRWRQCDLAARVAKRYGGDAIGEFAKRANIPKNRAKEYRTMGAFYFEREARADFLGDNPTVTYSHMRSAARVRLDMKAITDKDRQRAYGVLAFGSVRGWSSDQTARFVGRWRLRTKLSKPRPKPVEVARPIAMQDGPVLDLRGIEWLAEALADYDDSEIVTVTITKPRA